MDSRFVEGTYGRIVRQHAWSPRESPRRPGLLGHLHRVAPDLVERFLELDTASPRLRRLFPATRRPMFIRQRTADRRSGWWSLTSTAPKICSAGSTPRCVPSGSKNFAREWGDFRLKTLPAGFGAWFAGLVDGPEGTLPPSWKIALAVLFQLYPTVMVLTLFVTPHLSSLGLAVTMLIGNVLSVSILQWVLTPRLNKWLGP